MGAPLGNRNAAGAHGKGHTLPWAPWYMVELEYRYQELRADRLMVEGAMRHEPNNNRRGMVEGRAPSAVAATTVRASRLPRVHDSFDARSAEDRSSERPYSPAVFAQDVATRSRNRNRSGDAASFTVPTWFVAALEGLDSQTRTAALASFERRPFDDPPYTRKLRKRPAPSVSAREARAAALRDIAGTIVMGEQG
jgi:hypothetical protein